MTNLQANDTTVTTPGTTAGTETEPAADRGHGFRPGDERTRRIARRGGRVSAATRRGSARRVVLPEDLPGPLSSPMDGVRWASWTARMTATGFIDTTTAGVLLRAVREHRASYDRAELAEELARLRAELDALKAQR